MWDIGAAGIGAPWVWLLIGSVGFQGNDITGQAWFEFGGGGGGSTIPSGRDEVWG